MNKNVVISLLHINITGSGIQNKNCDICHNHKRKRVETGADSYSGDFKAVGAVVSNGKTIMRGEMVNNGELVNDTSVYCSPCDMPKSDARGRRRDVFLKVYLIKQRYHQPGAPGPVCNTLLPSQSRLPPYNCIVPRIENLMKFLHGLHRIITLAMAYGSVVVLLFTLAIIWRRLDLILF